MVTATVSVSYTRGKQGSNSVCRDVLYSAYNINLIKCRDTNLEIKYIHEIKKLDIFSNHIVTYHDHGSLISERNSI